jgi:hypothetical protein
MNSLSDLDAYTQARNPALAQSPKALFRDLKKQLLDASNNGAISTSPQEILGQLKLFNASELGEKQPVLANDLLVRELRDDAFSITGGQKNQNRSLALHHFARDDGAWFDFTLTGREYPERIELLAYDFEIRLRPGSGAPFLRFDLNLPDHRNDQRDLRSHLHCGTDDLLLPAPLMTPGELLALFIYGIRIPASRKAARTVTRFECNWFVETSLIVRTGRPDLSE